MGRTACTEPQCLYKGDLYLYFTFSLKRPLLVETCRSAVYLHPIDFNSCVVVGINVVNWFFARKGVMIMMMIFERFKCLTAVLLQVNLFCVVTPYRGKYRVTLKNGNF